MSFHALVLAGSALHTNAAGCAKRVHTVVSIVRPSAARQKVSSGIVATLARVVWPPIAISWKLTSGHSVRVAIAPGPHPRGRRVST